MGAGRTQGQQQISRSSPRPGGCRDGGEPALEEAHCRARDGARNLKTSCGLLGEGVERVRVYRFIDSQRTSFPTKALCRVCEVAPSSFYAWVAAQAAGPDEATLAEAYLANRIHDIWTESRRRYGVPRVTAQLWREGVRINRKW